MHDTIVILDFGSQYTQLIARRVRENNVYAELFPWNTPASTILALNPKGFILSGGPASVFDFDAPRIPSYVFESRRPILGICYGMQALTYALGGEVAQSSEQEYGLALLQTIKPNPLLPEGELSVWMSHGDRIEKLPNNFIPLAKTDNSPIAAMGNLKKGYYGVQFHPEVRHTRKGSQILRNFVIDICETTPDWTPRSIIENSIERIREKVGNQQVLSALSGGVDSSVATMLVYKAIGNQLSAIFIDNGLLRKDEAKQIVTTFKKHFGVKLIRVNAVDNFMEALKGIENPEKKRRIIGERFIRIFENQAKGLGLPQYLVQGTIYPDVIESRAPERAQAQRIKTHHNVGGLPKDINFKLLEPLRYLFKDEVRQVGIALGIPEEIVWRQPFPGPGLAVRCIGEINKERLERLREADAIFCEELEKANLLQMNFNGNELSGSAQAFAVLLPVQSVGVMGDQRTYQEVIALRAVTTEDFMTADWARLPYEILAKVANRIVNEVRGVNRVVYDISTKPPATIEWE
ncbi:MAG: glutamine-hydrolyzing GMP synthase [Anaerolineales bacterium]|nr:glutamine-hydrolyzing GMP synthase [Anaerolineales bacterium]